MKMIKQDRLSSPRLCIGSGYFALDVVFNELLGKSPKYWAGGSCGNVLTILASWGWDAYPIARLGKDRASKYIIKDIKSWGVKTKYVFIENDVDTPIVIERIKKYQNGKIKHKFEWICPFCGSKLPHYRPFQQKEASIIVNTLSRSDVFYFDRVSKGVFEIASYLKNQGSVIFFEPSSNKSSELFKKCLSLADIVKYSNERISDTPLDQNNSVPLEIQTLGENGLRFRRGSKNAGMKKWCHLKAYPIENFIDSTGAGDWCTAGIIQQIGGTGISEIKKMPTTQIIQALNYGQSFAALNCHFEGARGLMYSNLSQVEIEKIINKILKKESVLKLLTNYESKNTIVSKQQICKNCRS